MSSFFDPYTVTMLLIAAAIGVGALGSVYRKR